MSTSFEETEVLRALYAGTASGFGAFLDRLIAVTRADGALLALGPETRWTRGNPPDLLSFDGLREGRLYAQGEVAGTSSDAPGLRVLRSGGREGLALWRKAGDFRAADGALLVRLGPHLDMAGDLWRAREAERADAGRSAALAQSLGASWVLTDPMLRVLRSGPGAERLLAGVITPDGFLSPPDPLLSRRLRQGADAALASGGAQLAALAEGLEAALLAESGRLLLRLRRVPPVPATLGQGLGLSRAESRLVGALAEGATLAEAAQALGWSTETARSTSKQVYSKLGVSGQPALLRRVLNGALWLLS